MGRISEFSLLNSMTYDERIAIIEAKEKTEPEGCPKCGGVRYWRLVRKGTPQVRLIPICKICRRAYLAQDREKYGGAAKRNKRWEALNREKALAHRKVETAVKNGRLVKQPCERCGDENVHAHHDDYSKPLEVMWLCPKHHKERHREIDEAAAWRRAA